MDNGRSVERLRSGAESLGIQLSESAAKELVAFSREVLRWNQKLNLTGLGTLDDVLEKHIIDSLALLRMPISGLVLDIGSGAGFPGLPLKFVRRDLDVTLVDSAQKKVAFLKHIISRFGLLPGIRAFHAHASGSPEKEGIPTADWVVSRAFKEPLEWLRLGLNYANPDGSVVAMLGRKGLNREELQRARLGIVAEIEYHLPFSGAARSILVVRPVISN